MNNPASTSSGREGHKQTHREMPLRDGQNNTDPRRPRRNKRGSPPPPDHDEAFVHTPWLDMIREREYVSAEHRLHDEIVAYTTYVRPTLQENRARHNVLACIENIVCRDHYIQGKVNLFGSCATGLWLPSSDIDIAISTHRQIDRSEKSLLFRLSSQLKSSGLTDHVLVNHHARVPILKLTTRPEYGSLSIDIGINNSDGVRGVENINDYLAKMPALRPLILVMKGFLVQRHLNDASKAGLGSYGLILMCISFLQVNPSKRPQELLDKPMENESLGLLLTDFLFYYGLEFPYTTSYISVTEGKVLPKESSDWITGKNKDQLGIECIVNPNLDVGKSLSSTVALQRVFKTGYAHILQLTTGDRNTLRELVAVNNQMLAQRARIAESFNSANATAVQPWSLHYPRNVPYLRPWLRPRGKERAGGRRGREDENEREHGRRDSHDRDLNTASWSSNGRADGRDLSAGKGSSRSRRQSQREGQL